MIGTIPGDMIGVPYEFDCGGKIKDFPLFKDDSVYTDDTVMTAAAAEALMKNDRDRVSKRLCNALTVCDPSPRPDLCSKNE